MKSLILFSRLLIVLLFTNKGFAQNVGIGTNTPSEKMELKNNLRTTLKISSANFSDTTQLLLSNRNASNQGTDFSLKNIREEGLFISSISDLLSNTSSNSLVILPTGNVGINEPFPSARLTVKGSDATSDGQDAAIKLQNTAPGTTNAWYIRAGAIGNNTPTGGFSIADNFGYHFNLGPGGNIGLGIAPSAAKLHVNGAMKIQGLNTLEFGAGVVGKEMNAGKIGYNSFVPDGLCIVGAGTAVANRKVFIFAEGGTTFNGPINVGGSIGVAGQVLTSNAAGVPTWENAAYSNNIRFAVSFSTGTALTSNAVISATRYNLNPTDVVINPTGITINRSGLYHFDMDGDVSLTFPSVPTTYPRFNISLNFNSAAFGFISNSVMQSTSSTNLVWNGGDKESLDVYITAPATITINHSIGFIGPIPTFGVFGYLTGHLIGE